MLQFRINSDTRFNVISLKSALTDGIGSKITNSYLTACFLAILDNDKKRRKTVINDLGNPANWQDRKFDRDTNEILKLYNVQIHISEETQESLSRLVKEVYERHEFKPRYSHVLSYLFRFFASSLENRRASKAFLPVSNTGDI